MRRFIQYLCWALLLTLAAERAQAFTLLGPFAPWQDARLGYNDPANVPSDPNGGPMNLGEGYRWNVPTIYYSYSPDFMQYFGQQGVKDIEKIIAILNALPSMDKLDPNSYPLQSLRVNYRAQALGLYDLKSLAFSAVVNTLGLTDPSRYVFTLRSRWLPVSTVTNYFIIQRNFDPITFEPSAYINGQLWTYYTIVEPNNGADSWAVTEPVDPLALNGLINAPVTFPVANNGTTTPGGFWTGLTRDDVGGLRYLYRSSNLAVETAPPNVTTLAPGASASLGSSSGSTSTWTPIDQILFPPGTTVGTGTGTGAGTGTGTTTTGATFVNNALRPGVGKINFVRVNYDSLFGPFPSNTVSYTDSYVTNGVLRSQALARPLQAPDIVFDAQDLVGGDGGSTFVGLTTGITFQNNDALNGLTGTAGPGNILPPGTTTPGVVITFDKAGFATENSNPGFLDQQGSFPVWRWGSFDGSTNAPIIYPSGTSILQAEQAVLSGGSSGGSSGIGSATVVSTWTPADIVAFPPGATVGGTTGTTTGTTTGAATGSITP